jgi:hypothetical protein
MSRTKIEIVKNDKLYDLNFTLQDASGVAVNLTGATLKFKAQKSDEDALAVDGTMTLVTPASGICKYQVLTSDFDEAGTYNAEIQVTFTDGQVSTWSDIIIMVKDELPK